MSNSYISEKEKEQLQFMSKEVDRQKYLYSLCYAQFNAQAERMIKERDLDPKDWVIDASTGKIIEKKHE